jgi:hypothetical protein
MSVRHLLSLRGEGDEIWAARGHPFNPDKAALAVGDKGNTFDH